MNRDEMGNSGLKSKKNNQNKQMEEMENDREIVETGRGWYEKMFNTIEIF